MNRSLDSPLGDLPASAPPGPDSRTFSAELKALARCFDGRRAQVSDLFNATQGRGYHLLLFVIALPFVGPVPLPGFSIPFGFAIAVIGARMAARRPPWLPPWLLRKELPASTLATTLRGAGRLVALMETVARPRLTRLSRAALCQRLTGALILISGGFMMLPLPLPFSNSLPAWSVLFLAAGSLADDGVLLLAGAAAFLLSTAFFVFVFVGGGRLLLTLFSSAPVT